MLLRWCQLTWLLDVKQHSWLENILSQRFIHSRLVNIRLTFSVIVIFKLFFRVWLWWVPRLRYLLIKVISCLVVILLMKSCCFLLNIHLKTWLRDGCSRKVQALYHLLYLMVIRIRILWVRIIQVVQDRYLWKVVVFIISCLNMSCWYLILHGIN